MKITTHPNGNESLSVSLPLSSASDKLSSTTPSTVGPSALAPSLPQNLRRMCRIRPAATSCNLLRQAAPNPAMNIYLVVCVQGAFSYLSLSTPYSAFISQLTGVSFLVYEFMPTWIRSCFCIHFEMSGLQCL